MKGWLNGAADRTAELANADEFYRELLVRYAAAEEEYRRATEKMTEDEQLIVDDYIGLCEEIQYQMTRLAYEVGVEDGVRMGRAFRKIMR